MESQLPRDGAMIRTEIDSMPQALDESPAG